MPSAAARADIAKMSDARRIATLMAFAITATERGQDGALELFDRLHGELLLRVNAQSQRKRLTDDEALDAAGRTLMDACRIMLDDTVTEPLREAVFAAVHRDKLATPSARWDVWPSRRMTARVSWCCRAIGACVATCPRCLRRSRS
jgi:hypothetical protein